VVVKFTDVLLTVAGVALTGLGVALFAARKR
jgi:LPXTG-motif cell wall-anchored protein